MWVSEFDPVTSYSMPQDICVNLKSINNMWSTKCDIEDKKFSKLKQIKIALDAKFYY